VQRGEEGDPQNHPVKEHRDGEGREDQQQRRQTKKQGPHMQAEVDDYNEDDTD